MGYLCVLAGSAAGGLSRYLLSRGISVVSSGVFPVGTMVINLTGCFIIGFLSGVIEYKVVPPNLRLFLQTGFLGGYTTFSTFGLETFSLMKSGEMSLALVNVVVSAVIGVALVFAGYMVSQVILRTVR
ncbi:MAG TPA: fluoride efflux transporter CrcB [Spirochaetota bacterium]|nr:fluoride efflux transporter CrcB [Spirochaetota bacterium]